MTDSDLDLALRLFNEMQIETTANGDQKPDVVRVRNGSQRVASDDPKMKKSLGKRDIPRDSLTIEWARREPHRREYIGKNEADGSVVLRVVLSDAISSDPEQLIQAVKRRCDAVLQELRHGNRECTLPEIL